MAWSAHETPKSWHEGHVSHLFIVNNLSTAKRFSDAFSIHQMRHGIEQRLLSNSFQIEKRGEKYKLFVI